MEERKDASPLSLMPLLMLLWQDYLIWLASSLTRGSSVQHAIILFIYPISNWKPLSDAPPIVLKPCLTTVILPLLVLQAEKLTQGNALYGSAMGADIAVCDKVTWSDVRWDGFGLICRRTLYS